MDLKLVLLATLAVIVAVEGRPKYIAIPIQDLKLIRQVRSVPRYAQPERDVYVAAPSRDSVIYAQNPRYAVEEEQDVLLHDGSDRYERQSSGYGGGNDHVDYGAYTGGYGAFGWYSDHPVCINCGYGHHRR